MVFSLKAISCAAELNPSPFSNFAGECEETIQVLQEKNSRHVVLPEGLVYIEEEAFEGTALKKIIIPWNVEVIGNRAFANISFLSEVYIPENTLWIGEDSFAGDNSLTLKGGFGSYAHIWAANKNIRFILHESLKKRTDAICVARNTKTKRELLSLPVRFDYIKQQDMEERRTGRTEAEIKAGYSTGNDSVYVRSRWFP